MQQKGPSLQREIVTVNKDVSPTDITRSNEIVFSVKNFNTCQEELPIIQVHLEGVLSSILLDTGSTVSIIDKGTLTKHIGCELSQMRESYRTIKGIAGKQIRAIGNVNLEIEILNKKYREEFVVLEEKYFPAQALFSFQAMKRCGIALDCSNGRVTIKEIDRGNVCSLEEEEQFQINLITLPETASSEEVDIQQIEIEFNANPGRTVSRNSMIEEIEEDRQTTFKSLEATQEEFSDSRYEPDNSSARQVDTSEELSSFSQPDDPDTLIDCSHLIIREDTEEKYLNEVLLLGNLKMTEIGSVILQDENSDDTDVCYTADAQNAEEICLVSTADDNLVKLKLNNSVILHPQGLTKVCLRIVTDKNLGDTDVLLVNEDLPDFVKMDNSLVRLNGGNCTTYVYNYSDKRLELHAGIEFCKGIVITNPLLTLSEKAFVSVADTRVKLEGEVNNTDFPHCRDRLLQILEKYRSVVAVTGDKLGRTDVLQHKIVIEDGARPFYIPNYKLPISQRPIVDEMVEEMKEDGVVIPSKSPYNSPLLLVPKKDGTWRMVIDYRKLNSHTIPDRMPMPVINDMLAQLGGAKVFSSLDLLSGYWQVPLDEESKHLTAFSTHKEHLQFEVMPFGLTSAPLTFVRLMLQILGDVEDVSVYLDDVIIASKDVESHFKTIELVLDRLRKAGLKVKIKKCQFLKKSLEYLGHVISEHGLKMQEGKIKAIVDYPAPRNLKALRRFLGMVGYYRPFIKGFATIAKPLTELTRKDANYEWKDEQEAAFKTLKDMLITDPILVYPDFEKEFYLACDASSTGLGAVLMQKDKTRMRTVYYASRVLNAAERNYSTTERECLALVWGLQKFRHILLGHKINVLTDHKPICDLFKKRAFTNNMKFNRWFVSVLEFAPEFRYIPGRYNTLADALSRSQEENEKQITTHNFAFSCQITDLDLDKVRQEQQKDSRIKEVIGNLLQGEKNSEFQLIDGLLYKTSDEPNACSRLYIPNTLIQDVLELTHSYKLSGHPGIKKTCRTITRNYFWPRCSEDATRFVQNCTLCNIHKGNVNVKAPLEMYPSELNPFQVVTMDFLGPFPNTIRGNKQILVFIDYLTRYVEIVPTRNREASTVAEAFKSRIITRHSCPQVLLSDNAAEFTSDILTKLCDFYEIQKCQITAYKPSSNGAVERTNRKIKDVLKTLVTPSTEDWDLTLEDIQFTLNNTVNESIGETPHFLLYGYQKRMPNSLLDDAAPPRRTYNYEDYIAWKTRRTYETVKVTRARLKELHKKSSKYYNNRSTIPSLKVGQQVYVLNHVLEGPNIKVSPKFRGPYRVLEVLKLNKFKLMHEITLKESIVHWNHIKVVHSEPWSSTQLKDLSNKDKIDNKIESSMTPRYNLRRR